MNRREVLKCVTVLKLAIIGIIVAGTIATLCVHTANANDKKQDAILEPVTAWEIAVLNAQLAVEQNNLSAEEDDSSQPPVMDTFYTDEDARLLALIIEAEYGGCYSDSERSGVGWTVLNRVDHPNYPDTIRGVIYEPNQFAVEYMDAEVRPDILQLAYDILERWNAEQNGADEVGRTLPKEALYFYGDGKYNHFNDGRGTTFVPDPTVYDT